VVLTILKNISQWEGLSYISWKIEMFETTNQLGILGKFKLAHCTIGESSRR
jgi:hypothetical protein